LASATEKDHVHPIVFAYPSRLPRRFGFSGKSAHRIITGGVGHNLPQEALQAFAEAVIDVAKS